MIGAALDLGQDRRGVDMGPSAIRYAGLDARLGELGHEFVDCGNVETAVAEATAAGDERASARVRSSTSTSDRGPSVMCARY